MTDVEREESETGKFSKWVHVKNQPADFPSSDNIFLLGEIYDELGQKLETAQLNIDGSKNAGVNVKTITEEDPDAATKNNGSYTFAYDGDGRLQYINNTFDATTWRKTLTYTSGRLSGISVWVKQ